MGAQLLAARVRYESNKERRNKKTATSINKIAPSTMDSQDTANRTVMIKDTWYHRLLKPMQRKGRQGPPKAG